MAAPLHNYVFPDGTQPIKVADPAPDLCQKENLPGMNLPGMNLPGMDSALDRIVGKYWQTVIFHNSGTQ